MIIIHLQFSYLLIIITFLNKYTSFIYNSTIEDYEYAQSLEEFPKSICNIKQLKKL